jgi:hypothetical protein
MSSRRGDRAIDDERRHRADPQRMRGPLVIADYVGVALAGERLGNRGRWKPYVGG